MKTYKFGRAINIPLETFSINDKINHLISKSSRLSPEDLIELKRIKLLKKGNYTYYKDYINALYEKHITSKQNN